VPPADGRQYRVDLLPPRFVIVYDEQMVSHARATGSPTS
jgi:hypothetical protein